MPADTQDLELSGVVAVVTGASRGIGRAIALRLASAGALVMVTGRTQHSGDGALPGSLAETVAAVESAGGRAVSYHLDLADPEVDRGAAIAAAEAEFGRPVQILVNNAAAERRFDLGFTGMTGNEFRRQAEVNVWAGWDLALRCLDGMRDLGRGSILNVSSMAAAPKIGPPYETVREVGAQCLYGGTKAMLDRLTTGAAMELWGQNIAVNALAPAGAVATENALAVAGSHMAQAEPLETMAEAALALCSGDPELMTGRVITSLGLLVELRRPVRTLDGSALVPGWQPSDIDPRQCPPNYLTAFAQADRR